MGEYRQVYQSLQHINKAWQFENAAGQWIQFNCPECIRIQVAHLIYQKTVNDEHRRVEIESGLVEFIAHSITFNSEHVNLMADTITMRDDISNVFPIRMSPDNDRVRANRKLRHSVFDAGQIEPENGEKDFIHVTNLEWLSLNWRKNRARKISGSFRRLILFMHENELNYFPTLREIRDGLIRGQMKILEAESRIWNDQTKFEAVKIGYITQWNMLFEMDDLGPLN